MVAEDLEGHQGLVLRQRLRKQGKPKIINVVVRHIYMHQAFVHGKGLSDSFGAVVAAFVVR
jgi:hypothetical protein